VFHPAQTVNSARFDSAQQTVKLSQVGRTGRSCAPTVLRAWCLSRAVWGDRPNRVVTHMRACMYIYESLCEHQLDARGSGRGLTSGTLLEGRVGRGDERRLW
jgi:hypothetical protein